MRAKTNNNLFFGCKLALFATISMLCAHGLARSQSTLPKPEHVSFLSADSKTKLTGYLYKPPETTAPSYPAIVMMHGRSGLYSSLSGGVYNAETLSARHKMWGLDLADNGFIVLFVDGFGPRGYPQGFPRGSYDDRPAELNEVTVRPLDAYGALAYLRSRSDVMAERIGLIGWSNGGSAVIAAMHTNAPGLKLRTPANGFRAAIAFYPGCGLKDRFDDEPFQPYAPMLVFHGTADEETSSERCMRFVENSQNAGGAIEINLFDEATHSFDTPTRKRQSVEANSKALHEALEMTLDFFGRHLNGETTEK